MSKFQRKAPEPSRALIRLTECGRYLINSAMSVQTMEAVLQVTRRITAFNKEYPSVAHSQGLVPGGCPGCGGHAEYLWEKRRGLLWVKCFTNKAGCVFYELVLDENCEPIMEAPKNEEPKTVERRPSPRNSCGGFFDL